MGCINEINGKTKLTGLLGSPVSHSKSPLMHNEAFRILGLNYVYLCFDVGERDLKTAFLGLKKAGIEGFNCTMPDKTRICEYLDGFSKAAEMTGAVNTVVKEGDRYIGYNTDGIGFVRSLADINVTVDKKNVTLLGTGGAASAIMVQLALDGVDNLRVFGLKDNFWSHAEKIIDNINSKTNCHAELLELGNDSILGSSIEHSDILVNATPVGMAPNADSCIIPDEKMLKESLVVSDIIYNPPKTKLYLMAEKKGCRVINGLYMLLYQGAASFKLWTGMDMPLDDIKTKYFS